MKERSRTSSTEGSHSREITRRVNVGFEKTCNCPSSHINCMTAKEWIKAQVAIQQFYYEGRDIRDKNVHPAVFPLSLPKHFIKLFTHEGELVLDPFVGIGTTLLAARDLNRNAIGFDLKKEYIDVAKERLKQTSLTSTKQMAINDDSLRIPEYLQEETVSLCITSPPYANMLNHPRKNKSIRGNLRNDAHFETIQQYSDNPKDLGTMNHQDYSEALSKIYSGIFPLIKRRGHVVINVNDVWENNTRYATHIYVIKALERAGFEFRNTVMWDKRNLVNNVGIFGWPSNFITLGTTMEFILDFWKK